MKTPLIALPSVAAFTTWAVVFTLSVLQLKGSVYLAEAIAWQAFIFVTLTLTTNQFNIGHRFSIAKPALIVLLLSVFLLYVRIPYGNFFIYLIIWIAIAPSHFSQRNCWLWLLAITGLWFFIKSFIWHDPDALTQTLLVSTFFVFALISALTAKRAEMAYQNAQMLNRELLTTQHLLDEASKEGERTRIARDLHDLLGHHLTALSINLQIVDRKTAGEKDLAEINTIINRCHALSKLLLSDVRATVSNLRESESVNIDAALRLTIKDIPRLSVKLTIQDGLTVNDLKIADVIVRCVQEAITNTLKHSNATTVVIALHNNNAQLELNYQDNGRSKPSFVFGNGLTGMQERLSEIAGQLNVSFNPGLHLDICIPLNTTPLRAMPNGD